MTLWKMILTRFDGDEVVARRYCRDRAKHYRNLAHEYPNLIQLAEGYERAGSVTSLPKVRKTKRGTRSKRKSA